MSNLAHSENDNDIKSALSSGKALVLYVDRIMLQNFRSYDSINLEVGANSVVLTGPNGAGKTTLIRAVCGRLQLDDGRVELMGEEIRSRDPRQAILGLVPQELAIYPELTAQQNLEVFGALHGVPRGKLAARINEILEWTQLESRRHVRVGSFSGGMQRRLNIACGVLHDPIVLLLDEPTVGVDPQSRERIFEMLQELKERDTAVVMTTHQLDEAEAQCDRIVIVDRGRTVASGTLSELIALTVGNTHRLTIRCRDAVRAELATRSYELTDIATDLPAILANAAAEGTLFEDMTLAAPSLRDVFLHLTGRELRE